MTQKTAKSRNGVPIRLPDERWNHIIFRHPELSEMQQDVLETIVNPEIIQKGDADTLMAVRRFEDKYLVVIYKEINNKDGFVVTAYLARQLSRRREILWER